MITYRCSQEGPRRALTGCQMATARGAAVLGSSMAVGLGVGAALERIFCAAVLPRAPCVVLGPDLARIVRAG